MERWKCVRTTTCYVHSFNRHSSKLEIVSCPSAWEYRTCDIACSSIHDSQKLCPVKEAIQEIHTAGFHLGETIEKAHWGT